MHLFFPRSIDISLHVSVRLNAIKEIPILTAVLDKKISKYIKKLPESLLNNFIAESNLISFNLYQEHQGEEFAIALLTGCQQTNLCDEVNSGNRHVAALKIGVPSTSVLVNMISA